MQMRTVFLLPFLVALAAACGDAATQPAAAAAPQVRALSAEALAERQRIASQHLAKPAAAVASLATAAEIVTALDLPPGMVTSSTLTAANPQAAMVAPEFGNIKPRKGNSLLIMSTGNINVANLPEPGTDYPPAGEDGDSVVFRVSLNVPRGSNRLSFDFRFLSAESPEFVGTSFNDTFTVRVIDGFGTREAGMASVNSSIFYDVSSTRAAGTGFDTLFADDPWGVDFFPASYPPEVLLFPDAGITDFRTVNVEVSSGGTVTLEFEIRDLGDGVLDSTVVVDNISFTGMEVVDPNPKLIHEFLGTVVTDPGQLSGTEGIPPVQYVAADGVTQVLVRAKVPGPGQMTFSLVGGTSPTSGGLGAVGTSTRASTVTVDTVLAGPGTHYAFALYTSPPDFDIGGFANVSSRPISISGQYTPTTGTGFTSQVGLTIVRPPLVLVHDIWSSCAAWSGTNGIAASSLFEVTCADYSATSAASLDSESNRLALPDAIKEALLEMRLRQTAVTQVDVIGHGMGGLLARKYVDWPNYRSFTNFDSGSINRLITMNTPHVGTRMADEIVKMREFLKVDHPEVWNGLRDLLAVNGTPVEVAGGTALDELLTTPASPINNIKQTAVPTHVMVSNGAQTIARTQTMALFPARFRILYDNIERHHELTFGATAMVRQKLILGVDSMLFCGDPHDGLVADADQRGGVTVDAVSSFAVSQSNIDSDHFELTNDLLHRNRLTELLNSPVGGTSFVQALPSPSTLPRVNGCGALTVGAAGSADLAKVEPRYEDGVDWSSGVPSLAGNLVITSPAPGTQVTPGGTVTVSVAGTAGFQPATVFILGGGNAVIIEAAPFSAQFQVPQQAIGSLELAAFGIDAQGMIQSSPRVVLPVVSSAQLSSIQVLNGDATLGGPGSKRKLVVSGRYTDGVTRDITSPALGTVYSTSNPSIATITPDGTLTGISAGIATITVRNGAVFTSITVTVGTESTAQCLEVRLGEYNLFVLEDYLQGNEVRGKVAAGRNISLENFSVGAMLAEGDTSNVLVAGGNLYLHNGSVWGDTRYGGALTTGTNVTYPRGTVARGTPISFASRASSLQTLSSELAVLPANGTTTLESWGGITLKGTDPKVNVFNVNASAFTGAVLLSIEAPADSLAVINVRGTSALFTNFGHVFSGGIDERGVLFNFPDATTLTAYGYGFYGTVLAPKANVTFNDGSWVGGMYARSLKGNAVGHIARLRDTDICK
ncbi:choice-of-anchor A family protein [Myxococcus sp. RHSTA-1-4]|uniref:choice-of-anchor A family protein n=1 Tax=Myxococcus sp. RHSTA-1-4 TaxID=2874601 RepID=UPI001CBC53BB|nr:choice-of-anchor A family protein [Myxococcus sp. RHSTA-1-4]MBZ4417972.1 choice-of-anchor A family protein [Myxococcus sp. RHSTA-1-4]